MTDQQPPRYSVFIGKNNIKNGEDHSWNIEVGAETKKELLKVMNEALSQLIAMKVIMG